jgi:hypothetical protein
VSPKAPHHTVMSWSSHWHGRHDLADKILASARNELSADSDDGDADQSNEPPTASRRRYKDDDDSSAASSESASEDEDEDEEDSGSDYSDGSVSLEADTEDDVNNMGGRGGSFTKSDIRIMAKYIASNPEFFLLTGRGRWEPFEAEVRELFNLLTEIAHLDE